MYSIYHNQHVTESLYLRDNCTASIDYLLVNSNKYGIITLLFEWLYSVLMS